MTGDERFMRRALSLAARGGPGVSPNPLVGCVLVKGGRVVGEGLHRRAGGPHAESAALARAGTRARGADAYINLEPCAAFPGKRTPSCAAALARAGVRRVVAAMRDPDPWVSGRGLAILRRAGVRVSLGLLGPEARRLNRAFVVFSRQRRPWVTLKAAATLDGRMADPAGRSKWITSPQARALARAWRGEHDAVLVGVGTVLADDPRLTASGGRRPLRAVLDARGRTPPRARLWRGPGRTLLVTAAAPRRLPAGAQALRLKAPHGRFSPREVLRALARRGVGRLFLEGGPSVHASFLAAGLVDEVRMLLAPRLLGPRPLSRALALGPLAVRRAGPDLVVSAEVAR